MNNTTITKGNLSLVAVLMAATLVIGTFATMATIGTTQSSTAFAYSQQKKKGGDDNSRNGNTVTLQACKQDGTESGFDNSLAQECENLICTHPGHNATCLQEGAATPTPAKLTCEQCFTKFLSGDQLSVFTRRTTLEQTCALLSSGQVGLRGFEGILTLLGVSPQVQAELIQCLRDAGIVFSTER
jgi:hypothetical protein